MDAKFFKDETTGEDILEFSKGGISLLRNSLTNRGSAFTEEEREKYDLIGLLPAGVGTIDIQMMRSVEIIQQIGSVLGKHVFLRALQDRNEVLFSDAHGVSYHRDDADHLYTDNRLGLPAVQQDLSSAKGSFYHL